MQRNSKGARAAKIANIAQLAALCGGSDPTKCAPTRVHFSDATSRTTTTGDECTLADTRTHLYTAPQLTQEQGGGGGAVDRDC